MLNPPVAATLRLPLRAAVGPLPSCTLFSRCSEPLARRSPEKDRIRRGDDALKILDRLPYCSRHGDRLCVKESIVGEQILQGSQQLDGSHAYHRTFGDA